MNTKKMIYLFIALLTIAVLLILIVKPNQKESRQENSVKHPKSKTYSNKPLQDVDFNDGEYALYIKHKDLGTFMVLDEKALKENKDKLEVSISWANYLPGEGDRSYGIILFKDRKSVYSKQGGLFKKFEIGNLTAYGKLVKQQRIQGVKKRIQEKRDSISRHDNLFITYQSSFVPDNRTFRFRVYFPSIAVPVTREKDNFGYERITTVNGIEQDTWIMKNELIFDKQWAEKIERCIRNEAEQTTDFEVSVSKGSLSGAYLLNKAGEYLKTPANEIMYLEDYMYYSFTAYIMANKSNAEKLFTLNYVDCMSEEERNRPQLITKMKAMVKQSSQPNLNVDEGEVGLEGYRDVVKKSNEIYEQEYSIYWLEILNKK